MDNNCHKIQEMIISYLSGSLQDEDKKIFLVHLSQCEACRKELAFMLKLKKEIKNTELIVPDFIKFHAFDKVEAIPHTESFGMMKEGLTNLLTKKIPTLNTPFQILSYLIGSVQNSVVGRLEKI